jgi:hypothetical protein
MFSLGKIKVVDDVDQKQSKLMFIWCASVPIDVFFWHRLFSRDRGRYQGVVSYIAVALIRSFLKHESLIYYQRDSAKAEASEDPFLPVEIHSP